MLQRATSSESGELPAPNEVAQTAAARKRSRDGSPLVPAASQSADARAVTKAAAVAAKAAVANQDFRVPRAESAEVAGAEHMPQEPRKKARTAENAVEAMLPVKGHGRSPTVAAGLRSASSGATDQQDCANGGHPICQAPPAEGATRQCRPRISQRRQASTGSQVRNTEPLAYRQPPHDADLSPRRGACQLQHKASAPRGSSAASSSARLDPRLEENCGLGALSSTCRRLSASA